MYDVIFQSQKNSQLHKYQHRDMWSAVAKWPNTLVLWLDGRVVDVYYIGDYDTWLLAFVSLRTTLDLLAVRTYGDDAYVIIVHDEKQLRQLRERCQMYGFKPYLSLPLFRRLWNEF